MTLSELPGWASAMLERERVARLGYLDADRRPRVLPVTFALAGGALWSAIDEKPKRAFEPARVRYLRDAPEAALCVDRYSEDWEELAWVQALGRVRIVAMGDAPQAVEALAAKYHRYRDAAALRGPLLRFDVDRALWWRAAGGN